MGGCASKDQRCLEWNNRRPFSSSFRGIRVAPDGAGVRTPTGVGPDAGLDTWGLRPSDDQGVDLLRSVFILWPMFALWLATGAAAGRAGLPKIDREAELACA